jgi:hypothetical protein
LIGNVTGNRAWVNIDGFGKLLLGHAAFLHQVLDALAGQRP